MNRAAINHYARRKEDKMEQRLIDIGFHLVEDTGRRTVKKGDKVMIHEDTGVLLVADSKSTQGEKQITLTKEMLEKIRSEAAGYDKMALGAIVFSFKRDNQMYIAFNLKDLEGVMY